MKSKIKHFQIKGKIIALLCMLILTVGAGAETVPADQTGADRDMGFTLEEPVDMSKTGSIMVHEKYGAGYKFTLYQVGIFEGETAAYTEEFAGVKSKVGDKFRTAESNSSEVKELAEQLKIWADTPVNKVKPLYSDKETDGNGNVTFENLVPGYYLIVSESVTENNMKYSADPVLIALAGTDTEGYNRKVEMKSERTKVPSTTPPPTTPPPTTPRGELPNTGVLWWPVPILAGAGFLLLLIGRIAERKKRK